MSRKGKGQGRIHLLSKISYYLWLKYTCSTHVGGEASVTVFYLVKNAFVKLKKDSPDSQKALYPFHSFLQLNFGSSVQIASAQLWENITLVLVTGRNVSFSSSRNWKPTENNWQESKYSHLGRHQTWEISGQGNFFGGDYEEAHKNRGFFSVFFSLLLLFSF